VVVMQCVVNGFGDPLRAFAAKVIAAESREAKLKVTVKRRHHSLAIKNAFERRNRLSVLLQLLGRNCGDQADTQCQRHDRHYRSPLEEID
jgi:hypothetical protein